MDRISKDDWPNGRYRQRRQLRLVGEALASGSDVVVDNTNPSPAEWQPLIDVAHVRGARVEAFWFAPDVATSKARNTVRPPSTRVPDVELFTTVAQLQRPSHHDGFDAVWALSWDDRGGFGIAALHQGQV